MIVAKETIRRTVAALAKADPGASEAELHRRAAISLGIQVDMVRTVMEEATPLGAAESEN
ncbi:MAG: hypothetical protein KKD97_15970 [Gammaproteobacteria bacterium]|nr:hypothetical protein [Gammaproteobacteria bacterium]